MTDNKHKNLHKFMRSFRQSRGMWHSQSIYNALGIVCTPSPFPPRSSSSPFSKTKIVYKVCELSSILGKQKQFKANILSYFLTFPPHFAVQSNFAVLRDRLVRLDESNVPRTKKVLRTEFLHEIHSQNEIHSFYVCVFLEGCDISIR
jgi:hypothetical protein